MALVRLPRELLLNILEFKDLPLRDRLSLRLVHPLLADLLRPRTLETVRVTISGEEGKENDNLQEFIGSPYLSELRGSARTLKIWIPCSPGNDKLFWSPPAEKESYDDESIDEREIATSPADLVMEGLLKGLRSCLPKLENVQLRAWCGRGGREPTKTVLRALGQLVRPGDETGRPGLNILLYGLGAEAGQRRNPALLRRIPDVVDTLELRGSCSESLQYSLEHRIADVLARCASLTKLAVMMEGGNRCAPTLPRILESLDMMNMKTLPLRHLEVNMNTMYEADGTEPVYSIDGDEETAIILRGLKSFKVRRRQNMYDAGDGEEFWATLSNVGVSLESIATESLGDVKRSTLMTYLASPQMGSTIKVLDLREFDWFTPTSMLDNGWETFWGQVLPNLSGSLEELILLMHSKNPNPRRDPRYLITRYPRLKTLHGWSLSHRTLVETERITFKNLHRLETYAILDREPESEPNQWDQMAGREIYSPYVYNDEEAAENKNTSATLAMSDVMGYLGEHCPKLTSISLHVFPGGPLRVLGGTDDDHFQEADVGLEIRSHIENLSREICSPDRSTCSYNFKAGAELDLSVVRYQRGKVQTVDATEYFYSSARWNKRRHPDNSAGMPLTEGRNLSELFPEYVESDEA